MLYFSLVVSAILLLLVSVFAYKAQRPLPTILTTSVVIGLASLGVCMIALPPAILQAVALGILASAWAMRHWQRRTFVLLSCVATLAIYSVLSVIALQQTKHLQEEFPYISLHDRLPSPKIPHPAAPLPPATRDRMAQLEERLEKGDFTWASHNRTDILRMIHENTVQEFVNRPGFGVTRAVGMREWVLRRVHRGEPISQPGSPSPSPWMSLPRQGRQAATDGLRTLHEESVLDFANPVNFGFIKDRQHVAGFQEHQISQEPKPPEQWALQRLDLIGLVLHKDPVAYVSENLPRMDELRDAPTRSLDEFETAGLSSLRGGEDHFVSEREGECRMLGAIRAVRQCLACHDGERGTLLGEFSYRLTSDRKEPSR